MDNNAIGLLNKPMLNRFIQMRHYYATQPFNRKTNKNSFPEKGMPSGTKMNNTTIVFRRTGYQLMILTKLRIY